MSEKTLAELSPALRRQIFSELVSCQDAGMTVEESRQQLAPYHCISVATLKDIEEHGISRRWPPLAPADDAA